MKKNYKSILILVTLILILLVFLLNVDFVIKNMLDYSIIFLTKLFPVSFILYIISNMLIEFGLIEFINYYLHINACNIFVFILSAISGFPSGAKYTKALLDKGLIDTTSANKIISFTHFPNSLFVLGTVKSIVKNNILAIYILFSIMISNFIIMMFCKSEKINMKFDIKNNSFSNVLGKSILSAFKTMILIYGTSLFFYLISSVIFNVFVNNLYLYVFLNGLFDLTNGVVSSYLINNIFIRCLYVLIFISFGSISIHMQVAEVLGREIKYSSYLKGRIIGTFLSIIIFIIFFFH